MKLSILSGAFCRFPLEKQFELISNIGFDGIELSGLRPQTYAYDMDERMIEKVLSLKEKYHLEIPMYGPELLMYQYNVSSPDEKERRDTIDYLKRSIDVAKGIGTKRVQVTCGHAGYGTDKEQSFRNIVNVLKEVCAHAEEQGIDLVLEPLTVMESNTIVMLDSAVDLLREVNSPNLKSMIDSAMVMTNWEPLDAYFEKLGSSLDYIHWGDSLGIAENHLHIGSGCMDPEAFFQMAYRRGYDGWVSVEMFGKYIREPEMHASRELRLLRDIFSKIG